MKFTGTLIEDLVATVERAEQKTQLDGDLAVQVLQLEPLPLELLPCALWLASVPDKADKFLGVA